jgi:hypothetical protein
MASNPDTPNRTTAIPRLNVGTSSKAKAARSRNNPVTRAKNAVGEGVRPPEIPSRRSPGRFALSWL